MPIMTQPEQRPVETDVVYLTVRHEKKTIMFFCRETDTVHRLKVILHPLMKTRPENQKLFSGGPPYVPLEDGMRLMDCGITSNTAKAQQPAELALTLREDGGQFGNIDIVSYSTPPPLPDVMKSDGQA